MSVDPAASVHPTAIVETGAAVGAGTRVWHFCHLMSGARVGARCVLGQGVYVGDRVVVGDGCRVQNHVSLYDGVLLGDDVFVGPSAVFTNVSRPRAFVSRHDAFEATRVGRGATIGANATIVCGHTLGAYCFIAAGAVVTADVPAHALMMGVPARQTGWVCRCAATLPLGDVETASKDQSAGEPPAGPARVACWQCGTAFQLRDGAVTVDDAP